MDLPLVTCIMPTLPERWELSELARQCFAAQTYPRKELIEDADPKLSIGAKRNALCRRAKGEIIIHWDDDDWSDHRRISFQVEERIGCGRWVTGFNRMLYYDALARSAYRYEHAHPYALGTSLCYSKSWWARHPFREDVERGEDTLFCRRAMDADELDSHPTLGLIVARYHAVKQPKPKFANEAFSEIALADLPEGFRKAQGILR